MTKREKITIFLLSKGCKPVEPSRSRKYLQFTIKDSTNFYWVGRFGAVRCGRTVFESTSVTDTFQHIFK